MKTINKQKIEEYQENNEDYLLINVLPKENFQEQHIPSSINIPFKGNANFVEQVQAEASSKDQKIVLYCMDKNCSLSEDAAQKLEDEGFTQIEDYEKGIDNWFKQESSQAA
jgi:rhodanese-related sulfurtransferase